MTTTTTVPLSPLTLGELVERRREFWMWAGIRAELCAEAGEIDALDAARLLEIGAQGLALTDAIEARK